MNIRETLEIEAELNLGEVKEAIAEYVRRVREKVAGSSYSVELTTNREGEVDGAKVVFLKKSSH